MKPQLASFLAMACLATSITAGVSAAEGRLEPIVLGLTGDLLVNRDDPESVFKKIQPALNDTDILFGNLEAAYTDDPHPAVTAYIASSAPMSNLVALTHAGYDVLSLANNHIMDSGAKALLGLLDHFAARGIQTTGAGRNLATARKPAVLERQGVKVAYLAYASIFPFGYEARANRPGLAPMRSHNLYVQTMPNYNAPGVPPKIRAVPYESDLAGMREDIAEARGQANVLVVSFHWGDFQRAFHLTDHEKIIARAAIDAGADVVVGHHHHILRGVEWYRGKPIFYGLGHFVFDINIDIPEDVKEQLTGPIDDPDFHGFQWHPDWPLLPMNPQARMTMLAYALVNKPQGVTGIGFLPARLDRQGQVYPVKTTSAEGKEILAYVQIGIASQGLNGRLSSDKAIELGGYPTIQVMPKDG